jgi:flagellar basal body-associated protein FliL
MNAATNKKNLFKKILLAAILLLVIAGGIAWYIFTDKFEDTSSAKAVYSVNALDLINEFKKNDSASNKKYAEQIVTVNGKITSVEAADTTVNLKITNPEGSYIIFAFQQKDLADAKKVKEGDSVSIKGSCSGGSYSEILETEYITFKRCSLNK